MASSKNTWSAAAAITLGSIACSSSEHPPVSDDRSVPTIPPPQIPDEQQDPPGAEGGPLLLENGQICEPFARRECLITYTSNGRSACTRSIQICKSDGTGWHACGVIAFASE